MAGLDMMDYDMLSILYFSKSHTTADDLIKVLTPEYCTNKGANAIADFYQQSVLRKEENGAVVGLLVDILRNREEKEEQDRENGTDNGDSNFATDFVEFATGARYLPQHGAEIVVEFNFGEDQYKGSEESLVVSHTCVRTIKLPGMAYEGDYAKLEAKLDQSIQYGLRTFNMQ